MSGPDDDLERPDGDDGDRDDRDAGGDEPLFGRFDAATLLAVEGANGGEWAGIGQALVTFRMLFGEWPEAAGFSESCQLLCEARLVEYVHDGLDLLPAGRKLLRRAGGQRSADRPARIAALLAGLDEGDLVEEGSVPAPSEDEVAAARGGLTDELTEDFESLHAANQARLVGPPITLAGIGHGLRFEMLPEVQGDRPHPLHEEDGEEERHERP